MECDDFDHLCRLCGKLAPLKWNIFGEEGMRDSLPTKIQSYLPNIKVEENDEFPQQICCQCASTVVSWHEFAIICAQVNEKFRNISKKFHTSDATNIYEDISCEVDIHNNDKSTIEKCDDCPPQASHILPEVEESRTCKKKRRITNSYRRLKNEPTVNNSYLMDELNESEEEFLAKFRAVGVNSFQRTIYQCDECDHKCMLQNSIQRYIHFIGHYSRHNVTCNFECDFCARGFCNKVAIYRHIVQKHLGGYPKKYVCKVCGKRFAYKRVLLNHQAVHTNERSFVCHICGKMYKSEFYVKLHCERVHVIGQPFLCHLCSASFKNKKYLQQHLRFKKHKTIFE